MGDATTKFEEAFKRIIEEDMTAASAGMQGTGDGFSPNNAVADNDAAYAEGDYRMPKSLFNKKKKKGKKKKVAVQTRPLRPGLSSEDEEDGAWEKDYKYECECGERWSSEEAMKTCKECNG